MTKHLNYIYIIFITVTGCNVLFTAQEWSNNYALLPGVTSTDPRMVDGNQNTIGHAVRMHEVTRQTIQRNLTYNNTKNKTVAIVSLPERKNIYKVIIYTDNIKDFSLFISTPNKFKTGENWERVVEKQDVITKKIILKFQRPYYTNQIKLEITRTHPEKIFAPNNFRLNELRGSGVLDESVWSSGNLRTHIPAKIQEIELYGYKP